MKKVLKRISLLIALCMLATCTFAGIAEDYEPSGEETTHEAPQYESSEDSGSDDHGDDSGDDGDYHDDSDDGEEDSGDDGDSEDEDVDIDDPEDGDEDIDDSGDEDEDIDDSEDEDEDVDDSEDEDEDTDDSEDGNEDIDDSEDEDEDIDDSEDDEGQDDVNKGLSPIPTDDELTVPDGEDDDHSEHSHHDREESPEARSYEYLFTSASSAPKYELRNQVRRIAAFVTGEGGTKSLLVDFANRRYYFDGEKNMLGSPRAAQKQGELTAKFENAVLGLLAGTTWPDNGEGASSLTAAWGLAIEKEDGSVHYTNNSDWGDAAAGLKETVDFLFFIPW